MSGCPDCGSHFQSARYRIAGRVVTVSRVRVSTFGGTQVVRRAAVGDVHVRLHAVPGPVEPRGGGGGDSRRPARPARHLPDPSRRPNARELGPRRRRPAQLRRHRSTTTGSLYDKAVARIFIAEPPGSDLSTVHTVYVAGLEAGGPTCLVLCIAILSWYNRHAISNGVYT